MKIIRIVLTGGPCGGKTTAMEEIKNLLNERGIKYIALDETATQIHRYNMPFKSSFVFAFQNIIFNIQKTKEHEANIYAKNDCNDNELFVILHDRGIIDNKAYLHDKDDFKKICSSNNMEEIKILDSYDLVLDLLSTATCKEEAYNLGNMARYETLEEAKEIDKSTTMAWINHRNLKILDSSITLKDETKMILKYINDAIDNKLVLNKYIFELDDNESDYSVYNDKNSDSILVTDYYIDTKDVGIVSKVSKRTYDNNSSYVYTEYENNQERVRIILDKQISDSEFYRLIYSNNIYNVVEKKELSFIFDRKKYTLCFYGDHTTLELDNISEVREIGISDNTSEIREIVIPDNLRVINKIDDNMFTNKEKSNKVKRKMRSDN